MERKIHFQNPLLLAALLRIAVGCSTPDSQIGSEPPIPEGLRVDPAAYGADHFTFGKRMKRRPANDFEFYFKHCSLIGRRSPAAFYMQSEYGCTPP